MNDLNDVCKVCTNVLNILNWNVLHPLLFPRKMCVINFSGLSRKAEQKKKKEIIKALAYRVISVNYRFALSRHTAASMSAADSNYAHSFHSTDFSDWVSLKSQVSGKLLLLASTHA